MAKTGGIPIGGRIALLLVAAVMPLAIVGGTYAWVAGETARQADMRARYETARVVAGAVESVVEGAARATDIILAADGVATDARCLVLSDRLIGLVPSINDVSIVVAGNRICGRARGGAGNEALVGGVPVVEPRQDASVAIGADGRPSLRIVRAGAIVAGRPAVAAVVHVGLEPIWTRLATSIAGLGRSRVFILTEIGGVIADPQGVVATEEISAVVAAVADARASGLPVVQVDAPGIGFVAIARVGATRLRVAVTSDASAINRGLVVRLVLVAGIPFLFLVCAVGIAWYGVDRVVNRWVRHLGRAAREYGDGNLAARVGPMRGAPQEFRDLGESFDAMATRMESRSKDLEHALAEKNHFVRELHHRVKNNFQMIASLLTLQRREAGPENEAAIREAHDRVQALAAAYRASYADGETGSVPLASLVIDLIERLRESAKIPSRAVAIDMPPDPISIHLDRGIPLALLLTELVAPLLDSRDVGDSPLMRVTTRLDRSIPETIVTRISRLDGRSAPERPLSRRLARAYAAQLGATVEWTEGRIEVRLPREQ